MHFTRIFHFCVSPIFHYPYILTLHWLSQSHDLNYPYITYEEDKIIQHEVYLLTNADLRPSFSESVTRQCIITSNQVEIICYMSLKFTFILLQWLRHLMKIHINMDIENQYGTATMRSGGTP
jgi:hypothetical protein